MAISGTVPAFHWGPIDAASPATVVTVTGVAADGQATGGQGTEGLIAFLRRGVDALALSGIASGAEQAITSGALSGVMQYQRELAFRVADLEAGGSASLERAQLILAGASGADATRNQGEVQFGA